MSTLKSRISSLASTFASEVVRAIQGASLQELLGEVGGPRPGPGRPRVPSARPVESPAPRRPAPPVAKSGRLPRRSPDEIKATLEKVHGLLKTKKDGLRAEEIRAALKLDVREMPRVLKEGLASKKLSSKGQKRATTYFAK
jgi:hypothetical protein